MAYFCYGRKGFCEEDCTICGDCKFYNGVGGIDINDGSELVVMVRQEVAREIFEEIEKDGKHAINFVENHKSYSEEVRQAKLECYKDIQNYVAELKKEYLPGGAGDE